MLASPVRSGWRWRRRPGGSSAGSPDGAAADEAPCDQGHVDEGDVVATSGRSAAWTCTSNRLARRATCGEVDRAATRRDRRRCRRQWRRRAAGRRCWCRWRLAISGASRPAGGDVAASSRRRRSTTTAPASCLPQRARRRRRCRGAIAGQAGSSSTSTAPCRGRGDERAAAEVVVVVRDAGSRGRAALDAAPAAARRTMPTLVASDDRGWRCRPAGGCPCRRGG